MDRGARLHAVSESLRRAGAAGRTAEGLALEYEVSARTIKRDLSALMAAGLPVWARPGPGGGYVLDERSTLPPVNFTTSQALALCAAVSTAQGAPFSDSARAATRKVLDVLAPAASARARALTQRVWVDVEEGGSRRVRSALEQALVDERTVVIRYSDAKGGVTNREVEPIVLALTGGRWYLVGWCRLRAAVRWFRFDRIERATVTRRDCPDRPVSSIGRPPESARPVGA